ncbi:hypothetical protein KL937_000472 [Ogataea polymorpha]|uniref:uncharacterized protein n=1 Tax=Ogataea polymorpha TaxID=460523 RepID=UPI0007F50B42|nr:uncharacterized protein OGAPODRAFT_94560 [Ogataea polymorpha]KAG7883299.1 hypothetical protein KL937_000472 [Ogataea polymorpha]KAG7940212.1 hypothetical protein KL904_000075 [Ogataea polymorpha]OBA14697.1 hypothetical protein OGAPODRAFT_94560 [Ogataea polymorpha]
MAPLVVKFEDKYTPTKSQPTKEDKKVLKSGRPITLEELKRNKKAQEEQLLKGSKSKSDEEDIKNDIALERLLSESHILADTRGSIYSGADLTLQTLDHENPVGNARVKALNSRIQKVAEVNGNGKKKLEKMPMEMRKGMIKAHLRKVEKYEREAKDAGIVLAKKKKEEFRQLSDRGVTSISTRIGKGIKKDKRIRDRGLKINTVGKSTRNGLVLSQKDIDKINKGR